MRRYRFALFAGASLAVLLALVGRGGMFAWVVSIYLVGIGLVVGVLVWLVGLLSRRDYKIPAANVVGACALQIASIPTGTAVNEWDVWRARTWCERTAPIVEGMSSGELATWEDENGTPSLVEYLDEEGIGYVCAQHDRTSFFRYWVYKPESGEWYEVD